MGSTTTFTRRVYVPPYLLDPHNDFKHGVPQILRELNCWICAHMSMWPSIQWNTVKHDDTINDIMWYFKMTISLPYITSPAAHMLLGYTKVRQWQNTREAGDSSVCVYVFKKCSKVRGEGRVWSNWEGVKTSGASVMCRLMPPWHYCGTKTHKYLRIPARPQLVCHPTTHLKQI